MGLFSKLRFKIALVSGLLLAGLSFLTLFFVSTAIDSQSTATIKADLGNTARVFEGLMRERQNSMRAQGLVLADSVQFKTALDDKVQDPATTADVASGKRQELGLDLFQVAGRRGALLASLIGPDNVPQPKPAKDAKPADPVFAKATDSENPANAFGAWAGPSMVFETYTLPIIIRDQVLGGLRIGFAMDDRFAKALHEQTGSEVAIINAGKVVASSLDDNARKTLSATLSTMQGMAKNAGDTGIFEETLDGVPYLGQFIPVTGPMGETGGPAAAAAQPRPRPAVAGQHPRLLLERPGQLAAGGGGPQYPLRRHHHQALERPGGRHARGGEGQPGLQHPRHHQG